MLKIFEQNQLDDIIRNENFEEGIEFICEYVKSNMESLENINEDAMLDIDCALYLIFDKYNNHIIKDQNFYKQLPDIFIFMKDPRSLFHFLVSSFKYLAKREINAFYVAQSIFHLIKHYNTEFSMFYEYFYNVMSVDNFKSHSIEILSFNKLILNEKNVSLKIKMSYIKKLARIAVNINSEICLNILNLIHILMQLNPGCYIMVNEQGLDFYSNSTLLNDFDISYDLFQSYLFEFDMLSCGIQPIRKIINSIRNESYNSKGKLNKDNIILSEMTLDLKKLI